MTWRLDDGKVIWQLFFYAYTIYTFLYILFKKDWENIFHNHVIFGLKSKEKKILNFFFVVIFSPWQHRSLVTGFTATFFSLLKLSKKKFIIQKKKLPILNFKPTKLTWQFRPTKITHKFHKKTGCSYVPKCIEPKKKRSKKKFQSLKENPRWLKNWETLKKKDDTATVCVTIQLMVLYIISRHNTSQLGRRDG